MAVGAFAPGADIRADDPAAASGITLQLRDGRYYHHARLVSLESESIVVNCDEGLVKIPRSILSQTAIDTLQIGDAPVPAPQMVTQPFDANLQATPTPTAKPRATPKPKPTPTPKPTPNPVFKGCTIVSFQPKPFETVLGCAEVVIQNDSDSPVTILPSDIACIRASGAQLRGHQFVAQTLPPIIRRREPIAAHASIDDIVTFSNDSLDIATVRWAH
jgi:hypothetical protein